jgi:hypothetical protein
MKELAALFFVTSRLFCVERPRWNKTVLLFESRCGFKKMRFYFSTATPQKITKRSQKWSCPFNKKAAIRQASLCAHNKAVAAFEKWAFISARSLRLCCTRTMKLGADSGFFVHRAALFFVTSRLFCVEKPC